MSGRVLVLGSEGNIGRPLVRRLRDSGFDVLESDLRPGWRPGYLQADINQPMDLISLFERECEVVFMLSAMVSRVTCERAAGLAVDTNLSGLNNVVQLCKRHRVRLVYFSTSEIYGPHCNPMSEDEPDPAPNNRYGLTKLLGEKLVEYEVRQYGLSAVTLRPFMVYDEDEEFGAHRSAMIRFAQALAEGKPIEAHRGTARSWLHSSDAVEAIMAATELRDYAVVNIGHGDVAPTEDLARRLAEELGADPSLIRLVEQPERMTPVKNPCLERMERLLGVRPKISLDEGIRRVSASTRARLRAAVRERGNLTPGEVYEAASGTS